MRGTSTLFVLVVVGVVVGACTTSQPMALPGGERGYMIGCSGIQHTMADCYTKATETCFPTGYDVVSAAAESHSIINPYGRSMVVRCKSVSTLPPPPG